MWRNPLLFTESAIDTLWHLSKELRIQDPLSSKDVDPQAFAYLIDRQTDLMMAANGPRSDASSFRVPLGEHMLRDARHIEDGAWSLLPELYRVAVSNTFMTMYLSCVHCLAGSEKYFLVGTRGNRPAWKRMKGTATFKELIGYGPGFTLANLDQSDVELWPRIQDHIGLKNYNWPHVPSTRVAELFEEAYYRQRYMVHPAGAYVRLRHFGALTGLTLKVKSGLRDPNYIDLVACFDVDATPLEATTRKAPFGAKKYVLALDGAELVEKLYEPSQDKTTENSMYLLWVMALIYHDLVTAETVTVRPSLDLSQANPATQSSPPKEGNEQSWVYIPRKIKTHTVDPRIGRQDYRPMAAHHVSGHLRKGKLSDDHRAELEDFERQTGLRVLDLLERNPGHTFVRPHVSPSVEGLQELPRFIHARLQTDIDRLGQQLNSRPRGG